MMSDTFCGYDGRRDEVIVEYLYGEMAAPERTAFTRHLTRCHTCQREIDALGDLRIELASWSPPDSIDPSGAIGDLVVQEALDKAAPARAAASQRPFRLVESLTSPAPAPAVGLAGAADLPLPGLLATPRQRSAWLDIPAWAQFAAAMLFLGLSAGIANLQITYNGDGLRVRTGWLRDVAGSASGTAVAGQATGAIAAPAVTQNDLTALAQQLRGEWQAAPVAAATPTAGLSKDEEDAIVRRVRALVRDSEQRQQRELALRVAEVAQDSQVQRQSDLVRIDRTLGLLQSTTGTAVRRQEQLLNSLAVKVSQRQ
jgi:hypothetical protein